MTRLRKFPTEEDIRRIRSQEWIDAKVVELGSYHTTQNIASYTGMVTPYTLHAFATFADALLDVYPDAKISRNLEISREKTTEEKEAEVISQEQSHRYYHPDEYDDVTADDIVD